MIVSKYKNGIVLAVTMVLVLCGCSKAEDCVEQGIAYMEKASYEEAAASFEEALQAHAWYTATSKEDILLYCGEAYFQAEAYEKAQQVYEELLELGVEKPQIYRFLGWTRYKQESFAEAKELFLKAVALGEIAAYGDAGDAAMALQSYEEAGEYYEIVAEKEPEEPKWKLALGQYELQNKNYETALTYMEQGLALYPSTAPWEDTVYQALLYHQAVCYEYMGQYEKARELFADYVFHYSQDEKAQKEYEFLLSR